jgi:hypothetical protein
MKKFLVFAAAASLFAACSNEELATLDVQKKAQDPAINFTVYTQRAVTRAGLPGGNDGGTPAVYGVTTASLQSGNHDDGFGVFGFYTNDETYDQQNSLPNFMYNQQVTYTAQGWTYEPVKYWPNEFGDAANSDDIDYLTFFAYAPWTVVDPSTGIPPVVTDEVQDQQLNITQITKNNNVGDPIIKYVVDTKPNTSVDLLWGVAAVNSGDALAPADGFVGGTQYQDISTAGNAIDAGTCFVDMTKEKISNLNNGGKIGWNFKHALAQLNVQIIAVVDQPTIDPGTGDHKDPTDFGGANEVVIGTEGDQTTSDQATKVYVRSISLGGFVMKGALNLHSDEPSEDLDGDSQIGGVGDAAPKWLAYDGQTDLTWDGPVTFYDGLKDGKEGTTNNVQKNETPTGLNPVLLEEYNAAWGAKATGIPTDAFVNLFDGATTAADPIYVIPTSEPMDIKIVYDVQTEDAALKDVLSDGVTHGSAVENKIYQENVFGLDGSGNPITIEAGKSYQIRIYVGLTSVKFDAVVTEWDQYANQAEVDLPANN